MKRKKYSPEFKREAIELVRRELSTGGPGDWCCSQLAHAVGARGTTMH